MDLFLYHGILMMWLATWGTNGAQVSFNTTQNDGIGRTYVARKGDNVALSCMLPRGATYADIYREEPHYDSLLVKQGVLYSGMNTGKYELTVTDDGNDKNYKLTIRDLSRSDSAIYSCWYCFRSYMWSCQYDCAYLHVVEDPNPEICSLVSNTNGVFFVGEYLSLNCPEGNLEIYLNGMAGNFKVSAGINKHRYIYRMVISDKIFNVTCLIVNDFYRMDYCRDLPKISVFTNLEVKITPESKEIPNGDDVLFTCKSIPPMPSTLEWGLPETGIMFRNLLITETPEGSRLTITNIDFRNSSQSYFKVTCNVTIGSLNAYSIATVLKQTPTTAMTSPDTTPPKSICGSSDPQTLILFVTVSMVVVVMMMLSLACHMCLWKYRKEANNSCKHAFSGERRDNLHTSGRAARESCYATTVTTDSVRGDKYYYAESCRIELHNRNTDEYYQNVRR